MTERVYRLREQGLSTVRAGDELVALDMQTSQYLSANTSGSALWDLLERGATAQQLVQLLAATWAISDQQAGHDVGVFLADLERAGLLA